MLRVPNLLVNGSSGIAVGMATNIPPHNLNEIIDATVFLIQNPNAQLPDLLKFVTGPDFPTGGQILGRQGILDAYLRGRGSLKIRAKTKRETLTRDREAIIVTEIPYQVNKSKLIEQMTSKRIEDSGPRATTGMKFFRGLVSVPQSLSPALQPTRIRVTIRHRPFRFFLHSLTHDSGGGWETHVTGPSSIAPARRLGLCTFWPN